MRQESCFRRWCVWNKTRLTRWFAVSESLSLWFEAVLTLFLVFSSVYFARFLHDKQKTEVVLTSHSVCDRNVSGFQSRLGSCQVCGLIYLLSWWSGEALLKPPVDTWTSPEFMCWPATESCSGLGRIQDLMFLWCEEPGSADYRCWLICAVSGLNLILRLSFSCCWLKTLFLCRLLRHLLSYLQVFDSQVTRAADAHVQVSDMDQFLMGFRFLMHNQPANL